MALFERAERTAFLFPGIGVKLCGREHIFFMKYAETMKPYLDRGSSEAGVNLVESLRDQLVFAEDLFSREIFAYCFSCGVVKVLFGLGVAPALVAGHSLGIYATLYAAGVIQFEQGLDIIGQAHHFGRRYCADERFSVCVIVGIEPAEVMNHAAAQGYTTIHLANINSENSAVYTGFDREVAALLRWSQGVGVIKAAQLDIDIPYHGGRWMMDPSRALLAYLERQTWRKPRCPVVSAIDGTKLDDPQELKAMTAANLMKTLNWPEVIAVLVKSSVLRVIECGAGISLSQHGRFIAMAPRHFNLKNMRRRFGY